MGSLSSRPGIGVAALIAAALALAACGDDPSPDTPREAPPATPAVLQVPPAEQEVSLRVRPKPGTSIRYRCTNVVEWATGSDLRMKGHGKWRADFELRVPRVDADGTAHVELEFERVWGGILVPGMGEYRFDSGVARDGIETVVGSRIRSSFTGLKGQVVRFALTVDGKMRDLELAAITRDELAPDDPAAKAAFRAAPFFERMRRMFEGLPPGPVSLGDTWPVSESFTGFVAGRIDVQATHELEYVAPEGVQIVGSGPVTLVPSAEAGDLQLDEGSYKVETSFTRADALPISYAISLVVEASKPEGTPPARHWRRELRSIARIEPETEKSGGSDGK